MKLSIVLAGMAMVAGMAFLPTAANAVTYDVTVKTGDAEWAGTNANVWLDVYSLKPASQTPADSGSVQLVDPMNGKNNFERNTERTFRITIPYDCPIKNVYGINIRQDGTGKHPDWFLDRVTLKEVDTGKTLTFPCNCWLNAENGTNRYLKPFQNF